MKLIEIIEKLELEIHTEEKDLNADIKNGYASDLLSDVMANAEEGAVWITLQTHNNIVAVAVLRSLAAIILVHNRKPDEDTLKKANEENIAILSTGMSTFEITGKLHDLGIRG